MLLRATASACLVLALGPRYTRLAPRTIRLCESSEPGGEGVADTIRVRIWRALASGEELSLAELSRTVGVSSYGDLRSHLRHVERQASTLSNMHARVIKWENGKRGTPEVVEKIAAAAE